MVYIYARMSSKDKEKLDNQIDCVSYFCEYMGYEVSRIFKEYYSVTGKHKREDYSGEERKALAELMKTVSDDDLVIMQSISRLSRQGKKFFGYVMDYITNKGANIFFIIEDILTSEANREKILDYAEQATKNDYKREELKRNGWIRKRIIEHQEEQQQGKKIRMNYIELAIEDYIEKSGKINKTIICRKYQISRPTFDKYLKIFQQKKQS